MLKSARSYLGNIFTLSSGTAVAQVIFIAAIPLLARFYSPEDFGYFALFMAVSLFFSTIISLRFEAVIMHAKADSDAIIIVQNCFLIALSLTILLPFLTVLFDFIFQFNIQNLSLYLFFCSISVFLQGIFNILQQLSIRQKDFGVIARAQILKALLASLSQLFLIIFLNKNLGLIYGFILGQAVSTLYLFPQLLSKIYLSFSPQKNIEILKRYFHFSIFTTPAVLLNRASNDIQPFLIDSRYSLDTVGQYGMMQKVLFLPSSLIGNAIGNTFYQKAISDVRVYGNCMRIFLLTLLISSCVAFPLFTIVYFFAEELFSLFFGPNWIEAAIYTKILVPYFFVKFVSACLSTTTLVFKKTRASLAINVTIFCGVLLTYISSLGASPEVLFKSLNNVLSMMYLCFLVYYFYLAKSVDAKHN